MIPIFFWWSHNIPSFPLDENPNVSPGRHRCALPVTLRFGRPGAQTLGDAHGARRKRQPGPGAVVPEVSRQRSQTFIDFPHQSHGNLPNPIEILMVLSHECVFYWSGEMVDDGWWWLHVVWFIQLFVHHWYASYHILVIINYLCMTCAFIYPCSWMRVCVCKCALNVHFYLSMCILHMRLRPPRFPRIFCINIAQCGIQLWTIPSYQP